MMTVNRDQFLVLVGTIAAGVTIAPACVVTQTSTQTKTIIETEEPATVQTTAAFVAAATEDGGTAKESPDPYKGTPIKAQSCNPSLNNVGGPKACSLKAPGPTCESFADTKQECPTMNKLLKPRVAAAAIDCMNRRSGTKEICEFNVSSICAYEALQTACIDPAAKAACNKVMARCGPAPKGHYNKMTQDACEAGFSGVADAKRAKFLSCVTESCRFETCLTYM